MEQVASNGSAVPREVAGATVSTIRGSSRCALFMAGISSPQKTYAQYLDPTLTPKVCKIIALRPLCCILLGSR